MKIGKDVNGYDMLVINNEDDAEMVLESFEKLQERAAKVARQLIELETGQKFSVDAEDITYECGGLYANWWTSCCGDSEDHQQHIPLRYLFDEDWQAEAEVELQRKKEEAAEQERIRKEKAEQRKAEAERKRYLELKEKFGE